jgi:hypothetical protein
MTKNSGIKRVVDVLVELKLYSTVEEAATAIESMKILINNEMLQKDTKASSPYAFNLMSGTNYKIGIIKKNRKTATTTDYQF